MNKNELYKLLAEEEKRVEKAKTKRNIITILIFATVFFVVFYQIDPPTKVGIVEVIGWYLACVFMAGIYFGVNVAIFEALIERSNSENRMIEHIRKQIADLEQQEFDQRVSEAKRKIMSDNE